MTGVSVFALAVLVAMAAGFFARSHYEKSHFETKKYVLCSEKLKRQEWNFLFLSDLHNNEFGMDNEKLIKEIENVRPDAVLIGGDMIIGKGEIDLRVTSHLVRELSSRFPVYYGNGNHEQRMGAAGEYREKFEQFKDVLRQAGAHYLSDESILLGEDIVITGCNLETKYYRHRFTTPEFSEEMLKRHVGNADKSRFQILLLHSPLFFDSSSRWGADLTLSGHFHGGTIRLPFLGGVMTPQYHFFLPACAGRFESEGKTMIVSPGLGTHSINIRFNNRPQLIWVQIKKAEREKRKEQL